MLLPPEEVDRVVDHWPRQCGLCQEPLAPDPALALGPVDGLCRDTAAALAGPMAALEAAVRLSLGRWTTEEEVDRAAALLARVGQEALQESLASLL